MQYDPRMKRLARKTWGGARPLRKAPKSAISRAMCFHMTSAGDVLPVWSKTAYDEVMLHCARIGFKP